MITRALTSLLLAVGIMCAAASPGWAANPVVSVVDSEPDGDYDQADIDAALSSCSPGCELTFLAGETYEDVAMQIGSHPDGILLTTSSSNPATLQAPIYEDAGTWAPVIEVLSTAPDYLEIENLILDGRKDLQEPDTSDVLGSAAKAIGIDVGNTTATTVTGGKITNVEIRDFVGRGIQLKDAPSWSVDGNVISGIGCYQGQEPCGDSLGVTPNPWDSVSNDPENIPGRKVPGFGINILTNSSYTIVSYNTISSATKMAFQVYSPAIHTCGSTYQTRELLVKYNDASDSVTGFTVMGGCYHDILYNVASDMVAIGGEGLNLGNGFTCGRDGEGTSWIGNEATDNQRGGFAIACEGNPSSGVGAIEFKNNLAERNCVSSTQATRADIEFRPRDNSFNTDLTASGNDVLDSECLYGLRIDRWSDVEVDGGAVESISDGSTAGFNAALWVNESEDVVVKNLTLAGDGVSSTGDEAIWFDGRGAGTPTLDNVLVHATTTESGFDSTALYLGGLSAGDADDVGYCDNETPQPTGCP